MKGMEKQFLNLVGHIYDTALDASLWPSLLQNITDYTHTKAAVFRISNVDTDHTYGGFTYGHDKAYLQAYQDHFIHIDPFRPALKHYPSGVFYPGQAAFPYDVLKKSEFFNDMFVANGLDYTMGGFALRTGPVAYQLAVQRGKKDGDFTQEDLDHFSLLIPHLQRAFQIGERIGTLAHQKDITVQALDQLNTGIMLCNEESIVFHMNKKAEEILSSGYGLQLISGKPVSNDLQDSSRLRQLICNATNRGEPSSGAMTLSANSETLRPLSLLVAPLNSERCQHFCFNHNANCAAIFIGSPPQIDSPDIEVIRMLYELTPAEARLAGALARGKSMDEICSFYQISVHTARTQLKAVFAKTGTTRQAELVNLILTSPAAL